MTESTITLTVKLTEDEAEAFAQLLKRADPEDFRKRAGDAREADEMQLAADAIRSALRDAGFAPR